MPEIAISNEVHARIEEFKQVVEAILDESLSIEQCVEVILKQGMYGMLNSIIGALAPEILRESIQQLGARYPAQIYSYVAENLRRGKLETERQRLRGQIGFHPIGE